MSETRQELIAKLSRAEESMSLLIQIRNGRKRAAELALKKANVEFDRDAIPLARKISKLRDKLEDMTEPEPTSKPASNGSAPKRAVPPGFDPDWTAEDIEHYQKLARR